MATSTPSWRLSPSDFAFLWEECKRCFYLKVARRQYRPRTPFPRIFNIIDELMKDFFQCKKSADISPSLPPGTIKYGDRWVQSEPIVIAGHSSTCNIRGRFDTVIEFEDGSYGVVDFKTTKTSGAHIPLYSRQLHAYACALERAAAGELKLTPVTKLGLLCVEPNEMSRGADGRISYIGDVAWIECPRDDAGFEGFLADVLEVLELPEPPAAASTFEFCKYQARV